MAKYTTQVRSICETLAGYEENQGYTQVESILEVSAPKIFQDFPIFNEDYRLGLEVKILRHYYTREISEETVALWLLKLNQRMYDIMPYYNQLYNSTLIEYNPLYDTDLKTEHNKAVDEDRLGTDSRNSTTKNDGWDKYSDTPQGGIDGLEADTYLTNADHSTNEMNYNTSGNSTEDNKTNEDFWETIIGKRNSKSYAEMINEYRSTFLNIDMMIIDELKDLFFNLW